MQAEDGAVALWFPSMVNLGFYGGAMAVDAGLLICMLGPFMFFHLRMAARNETTIESYSSNAQFDVGMMQNLRSVFGRHIWTWPLPLYLQGPDGDGLHWPSHNVGRLGDYAAARRPGAPAPQVVMPA